ncbi:MAG: hypothetical protein AB1635_07325 [Acidobacteriota bacterium]
MTVPYLMESASEHAAALDGVLAAIHWHMLVLALGWGALFLYALIRFRRRAHPVADHRGLRGPWPALAIAAVIVGDVVVLAASALPAWIARISPPPPRSAPLAIRVIGEQFAWNVHYPGPDGVFGPTSAARISASNPLGIDRADPRGRDDVGVLNVLVLPVGRTVVIELGSRDVVHAFTLPQMRVKQDMVPGMTTRTWFTPVREGRWEIVCSQLCGLGHYRMKGEYAAVPDAEWRAWMENEQRLLSAARDRP